MEKLEFIEKVGQQISEVLEDKGFLNERNQLRAEATLLQLAESERLPKFTFNKDRIWRNAQFLLSSTGYIHQFVDVDGFKEKTLEGAKIGAEILEALFQIDEKLEKALICSCLAYHIAGYQANALYLAGRLENFLKRWNDNGISALLIKKFFTSILYFLQRSTPYLKVITQETESFFKQTQSNLLETIESSESSFTEVYEYAAQMLLHQAMGYFASYNIGGNKEFFRKFEENLENSYKIFSNIGDFEFAILLSELVTAAKLFQGRSTWKNIVEQFEKELDYKWKLYLRNAALGRLKNGVRERSIVEFWESQLEALRKGLVSSEKSFIIQMPTSSGKTKVAEISMLSTLIKNPGKKCVYIAPFRALAAEIENSLAPIFAELGYRVSVIPGGFENDISENHLAEVSDVIVATPEKLDLFFRFQPEYFENVAMVIIDEGHIIEQIERGAKLELLLTRLKRKLIKQGSRFLLLSAVLPEINAKEFAMWLANDENNLILTEWRPTRQLLGRFKWEGNSGWLEYPDLKITETQYAFVPGILTKTKRNVSKSFSAAKLSIIFVRQGPILVFCSTVNNVYGVAEALIEELEKIEKNREEIPTEFIPKEKFLSVELTEEWLGEQHGLVRCLKKGIGLHYGSLPQAVREAIEDDYRDGRFKILIATNTLGQGVNLPIKTAIIHSLSRGIRDKINVRDFWNICGRAGRAGHDTEGQIIFISHSLSDMTLFNIYANQRNIEPAKSVLYKILKVLIDKRIDEKDILEFVREFLIDAHLLSFLVEEAIDTPDEKIIEEFLNESLVKIQTINENLDLSPLTKILLGTCKWIYAQVPDKELRSVFARTGLSIASCLEIKEKLGNYLDFFSSYCENPSSDSNKELLRVILNIIENLPEIKLKRDLKYSEGFGIIDLIWDWIKGVNVPDINSKYAPEENVEDVANYIDQKAVFRISWGINGFIQILVKQLENESKDGLKLPLFIQYLPSMIKYGVNNHYACWARSLGVHSRKVAIGIGKLFVQKKGETENPKLFNEWFKDLDIVEYVHQLGISPPQIELVKRKIQKLQLPDLGEIGRILEELKTYGLVVPIKGIYYVRDGEQNISTLNNGEELELKRDYLNEHDINAVKIIGKGKELGYLPKEIAWVIAPEIDFGVEFTCVLINKVKRLVKIKKGQQV